ncbi:hypothetical protein VYU27_007062 [Nannochloropsis oceanica]
MKTRWLVGMLVACTASCGATVAAFHMPPKQPQHSSSSFFPPRRSPVRPLLASPSTTTSTPNSADIFDQDGSLPSLAPTFPRSRASSSINSYNVGPVDPRDDRETRPSAENISEEEMEEVARKWEKRKAARRERITKQKGAREAMLDEAEDVIPDREVPLWYALKVKNGMELYLRDTLAQLATLPEYRGQILETLVPMAKSVKSLGKQLRLVEQPLHRGYVFIHMAMNRELHDAVLSPNGVGCFIGRRVYGKGIIPNPLRAKEADRLKERAMYEAGRTIDLDAIPFRPQDRVDVLVGEFAYSRGRVTSVKETEVNVAVKRNKVEVRVTLPQSGVRKLTQEELDQEAREAGEEGRRAFDRARGTDTGGVDGWGAIARSNEAAAGSVVREKKKKAPERRGPSLYRILSDYVNLENFDPNKPPQVEEMVGGMLELTGQKEDVGGYYKEKFENAKKAWECWKNYLEEKEDRRKAGRERALRRKAMGYDEHNDNWKGPSWQEGGREGGREGGGRGWDRGGVGLEEKWVPRGARRGQDERGEEDREDKELEDRFLDQLMFDLDGTPGSRGAKRVGAEGGRAGGREGRGRGESTLGDDELEALIHSSPVSAPPVVTNRRGGEGSGEVGRSGEAGAKQGAGEGMGTLSEAEQKELDVWLGMISSGKAATSSSSPRTPAAPAAPTSTLPGMGGQARAKPPSGARGKEFTLDPEEEKELNEWLSRFDADYKEGADGLKVEKKKGWNEGEETLEGVLGLGEGGGSNTQEGGKRGREAVKGDDAVDRELAELLAKLEAAESRATAGTGAGDPREGGREGRRVGASFPTPTTVKSLPKGGAEAALEIDDFLSELNIPTPASHKLTTTAVAGGLGAGQAGGGREGGKGRDFGGTLPSFDSATLLKSALEDVGSRGAGAKILPISSRSQRRGGREEDEEDDDDDDTLPATVKRRYFVSRSEEEGEDGGNDGDDDDEEEEEEEEEGWGKERRRRPERREREGDDLLLGAYGEDPEDSPGQFLEEGLEEAVHLGRPRGGLGGMKQGFMFDDPLGGNAEPMQMRGGREGGREGGKVVAGKKGGLMGGMDEDEDEWQEGEEDLFGGLEDLGDLEDLEKLDKLFAEEARKGKRGLGIGGKKGGRMGEDEDEEVEDWGALLNDLDLGGLGDLEGLEELVGAGKKGEKKAQAVTAATKTKASASSTIVKGTGAATTATKSSSSSSSSKLSPSAIAGMKVADLKVELKAMGLAVSGTKGELQARLREATE